MIDLEQEDQKNLTQPSVGTPAVQTATPSDQPAKTPAAPAPKSEMSKGEKWFNRVVYSWLNYWTNLGISVASSDYMVNNGGRPWLDRQIARATKVVAKAGVSMEKAHHHSKTVVETLTLLTGGYLLLIPLKLAEDRKRPIVHWINKTFFGGNNKAPDGHEETPDEIYIEQEQPAQTWTNVVKRRLLGTLLVIGSGSLLDHALANKKHIKPAQKVDLGDGVSFTQPQSYMGGKEWTSKKAVSIVNGATNKGLKFVGSKKVVGVDGNHWSQRWLELAALDTVFTKVTALTMWLTRGAKKEKMPNEIGEDEATEIETATGEAPLITHIEKEVFRDLTPAPARKNAILGQGPRENFTGSVKNQDQSAAPALST